MALTKDLWLFDFGDPYPSEPAFCRPALVVGPPEFFGSAFPFIFVVPLTTVCRKISTHIEIEANQMTGLDKLSYAQCEQLRSVNKDRAKSKLGAIDFVNYEKVSEVLKILLNH